MVKQVHVIGISIHTSQLAAREVLQHAFNSLPNLSRFCKTNRVDSMLPIFTCNRAEWVILSDDITPFQSWVESHIAKQHVYSYEGMEAIWHVLRVTCGLDATIKGEAEVLGQMKSAIQAAKDGQLLSEVGYSLMLDIINRAKKVRSMALLDSKPHSIVQTIRYCLEQVFSDLKNRHILLIGAGEMNQLCARRLQGYGFKNMSIANRTLKKAAVLAAEIGASPSDLQDLPERIDQAEILLVATSANEAIIRPDQIGRRSLSRPLMIFDLSVPRNVDLKVRDLPGVYLFDMDDLNKIHQTAKDQRDDAIELAYRLAESASYEIYQTFVLRLHAHVVASFRGHLTELKDEVLAQAEEKMDQGADPGVVIKRAVNQLLHKALHKPTVLLRRAIKNQDFDMVKTIDELMGVEE